MGIVPWDPFISRTYGVSSLTGLLHGDTLQITPTKVGAYCVSSRQVCRDLALCLKLYHQLYWSQTEGLKPCIFSAVWFRFRYH